MSGDRRRKKPALLKVGDTIWHGYARVYIEGGRDWCPEIRPGKIVEVQRDGLLRLQMEGVMPGSERKRNPGAWMVWGVDPATVRRTPEDALEDAHACVALAKCEEQRRPSQSEERGNG